MMRTWKSLGSKTILAAALTATPLVAQQTDGQPTPAQIQKQLADMQKEIGELKKAVAPLGEMQKKIDDLVANTTLGAQSRLGLLNELRDQLGQLKTDVQTLRDRMRDGSRIAGFPPSEAVAAPTGRVEIVNTYAGEVWVVVNQRTYRVLPGETRYTDPVPSGTFTYEVLGITPLRTRTIAANETFRIQVYPGA